MVCATKSPITIVISIWSVVRTLLPTGFAIEDGGALSREGSNLNASLYYCCNLKVCTRHCETKGSRFSAFRI